MTTGCVDLVIVVVVDVDLDGDGDVNLIGEAGQAAQLSATPADTAPSC